jgi:hypothetical protein
MGNEAGFSGSGVEEKWREFFLPRPNPNHPFLYHMLKKGREIYWRHD